MKLHDKFRYKTYGRVFVAEQEHIAVVHEAIKEVDAFEFEYMPEDLVAVYKPGGPNLLVYLHKFEIDKTALAIECMNHGVWIWCIDGGFEGSYLEQP